jgi:hypothetical protein
MVVTELETPAPERVWIVPNLLGVLRLLDVRLRRPAPAVAVTP